MLLTYVYAAEKYNGNCDRLTMATPDLRLAVVMALDTGTVADVMPSRGLKCPCPLRLVHSCCSLEP